MGHSDDAAAVLVWARSLDLGELDAAIGALESGAVEVGV